MPNLRNTAQQEKLEPHVLELRRLHDDVERIETEALRSTCAAAPAAWQAGQRLKTIRTLLQGDGKAFTKWIEGGQCPCSTSCAYRYLDLIEGFDTEEQFSAEVAKAGSLKAVYDIAATKKRAKSGKAKKASGPRKKPKTVAEKVTALSKDCTRVATNIAEFVRSTPVRHLPPQERTQVLDALKPILEFAEQLKAVQGADAAPKGPVDEAQNGRGSEEEPPAVSDLENPNHEKDELTDAQIDQLADTVEQQDGEKLEPIGEGLPRQPLAR